MKKSVLVFSLYLLLAFQVAFAAGKLDGSTLKATISVQQTMISELEAGEIQLFFEISNRGKEAVDAAIINSRLSVNNQEVKNWNPYTAMPGVLQPGQTKRFSTYLRRPFTKPGTYKVRWQSEVFQLPPLKIRVLRDRVKPAGQEPKHFALIRAIRAILPSGWQAHGEKWPIGQLVKITRMQPTQMGGVTMPNMNFNDDYAQKPLPEVMFEISLLTQSFIHPAYYRQIKIDNAKIDLLLSKLHEQMDDVPTRKGQYRPKTTEHKKQVAEFDRLDKARRRLPEYYYRDLSLSFFAFNGHDDKYQYRRVQDKAIRAECREVTQRVINLLSSYEPQEPLPGDEIYEN